jgi:chromosome segregation ATPase
MGNPSNNSEQDKLVRSLENIQRRIDETNQRYMERENLLNSKIEQLVENMRSNNDTTTKDEWFSRAKEAGERIHASWNNDLENLELRKEEIQSSLKQLESQPDKHDFLQEKAWTMEQEIAKQESARGEQIESMENELWEIEDQLQTLYHRAEERRWKVEDEFNQNMEALETRRFDLEDKRQALDQEAEMRRNQLINEHENKMALTRDKIDEIYQNEFLPIRDRIEQLEFELVELRGEERRSENQDASVNIEVGNVTSTSAIQLLNKVLDTAKASS